MKVVRVVLTRYRLPFQRPYLTAAGSASHREGYIVRLETEDGLSGVGEAVPLPHEVIDAAQEASLLDGARRHAGVRPGEPVETGESWVAAGFETARADLFASSQGLPIYRAIGGGGLAADVAVNALIDGRDARAVAAAAASARAAGFETVKLKVGLAATVAEEVARAAAAREAIGAEVKLRLDANGVWGVDEAVETLRALTPYDLEYVEQPVAAGDIEGMKRVRQAVAVAIAADESVVDAASVRRLIDAGAAELLVLKPLQLGGVQATYDLIAAARDAGVGAVITTSIDSGVGTAAALHLAAVAGGTRAHGLATLPLLEDDLIAEPGLPVEAGRIRLPRGPGLGVGLDAASLARYAVRDWEFTA